MEKKIKGFYFGFMPLGLAIKQAGKEMNISREKLAEEAGAGADLQYALLSEGMVCRHSIAYHRTFLYNVQ